MKKRRTFIATIVFAALSMSVLSAFASDGQTGENSVVSKDHEKPIGQVFYVSRAYSKPIFRRRSGMTVDGSYHGGGAAQAIGYVSRAYTKGIADIPNESDRSSKPELVYVNRAYNKAIYDKQMNVTESDQPKVVDRTAIIALYGEYFSDPVQAE